jgi:ABC-type sugar transport system substrate-binding protein
LVEDYLQWNPYGENFAVKPDGTPYKVGIGYIYMGSDAILCYEGVFRTQISRTGAYYIMNDGALNIAKQIAWVQDMTATVKPDMITVQMVDEVQAGPAIEEATKAGIPVFSFDCGTAGPIVSWVHHLFEGPTAKYPDIDGANLIGEYFRDLAEQHQKPIDIFILWGPKSLKALQDRKAGLLKGIDDHPLVSVTDSPETDGSEGMAATVTMDAFTTNPDLNAIFTLGGGGGGCVSGLKAIGRLYPADEFMINPDAVCTTAFEGDLLMQEHLDKGNVACFGTHGGWDVCDAMLKVMYNNVILGMEVPKEIPVPMYLLTAENCRTEMMFGSAYWTVMPRGEYEDWPVLDMSIINVPQPTLEDRMEILGY